MRDIANVYNGRYSTRLHYRASEGDVLTPKRPGLCTCVTPPEGTPTLYFYRDPHPGGKWCRSCGKNLYRKEVR